jgi:hypothetical protein
MSDTLCERHIHFKNFACDFTSCYLADMFKRVEGISIRILRMEAAGLTESKR